MITVQAEPQADGWKCTVQVGDGAAVSRHTVRVRAADLVRLGRAGEKPEQLVTRAFEFLLAREPASSILRDFELADISRYFPEFERMIRA
ncbi:MAG TPA: hypothetical protein VKI99_10170 [Candidatus Dormibacteraeota bacterium]|nr:hypothetical protein [Candidatus Dormibacteraeota bacterium]